MNRHLINCYSPPRRRLNAKLSCLVLSIGLLGPSAQAAASDDGARLTPEWAYQKKGETTRVSVASDGTQGNARSAFVSNNVVSADGRYVTFESKATNLVAGDTNGTVDIFIHDRFTRKTTRVSVASDGTQGDKESYYSSISADGRFVVFVSRADNLVPGDTNGASDIFVHDRKTGHTTRVSIASDGTQGNGGHSGGFLAISADGRFVVFDSMADNLVPGDTNGVADIFVHDLQTKKTSRVSVASDGTQGNGFSSSTAISADGRFVSFWSNSDNLVSEDTNGVSDIFVHDLQSRKTGRVSVASDGTQGNDDSSVTGTTGLSADGRYVAFGSHADNLVPGDTNGCVDIFVHDRMNGKTMRVNLTSDGMQVSCSNNESPGISADGRFVTFRSSSDDLVPGDINGAPDIFIHDRKSGDTSIAAYSENAIKQVVGHAVSTDARYVAFWASTGTLVPGTDFEKWDVFIRDRLLLPDKKADLSVTQTQSVKTIRKGRPLTYTITVKNNGRDFASDVSLTDLVPLNAQLRSVTSSQGSCYQAPITICRLGRLAAGAQAKVKLTVKANQTGVLNNTVYVNAPPKDLVPKNNTSTLSTQVN